MRPRNHSSLSLSLLQRTAPHHAARTPIQSAPDSNAPTIPLAFHIYTAAAAASTLPCAKPLGLKSKKLTFPSSSPPSET